MSGPIAIRPYLGKIASCLTAASLVNGRCYSRPAWCMCAGVVLHGWGRLRERLGGGGLVRPGAETGLVGSDPDRGGGGLRASRLH